MRLYLSVVCRIFDAFRGVALRSMLSAFRRDSPFCGVGEGEQRGRCVLTGSEIELFETRGVIFGDTRAPDAASGGGDGASEGVTMKRMGLWRVEVAFRSFALFLALSKSNKAQQASSRMAEWHPFGA